MNGALAEAHTGLSAGGHICQVVTDGPAFEQRAREFLAEGRERGEKTIAFGPQGSAFLARLEPLAALVADPYVAFLGRRSLEPETMFAMFREQAEIARDEGYSRIRLAADMDWLLPAAPTAAQVTGFELLLDRVVGELDATVLCAYRRTSFEASTILGARCVHPVRAGNDEEPPFTLVAGAVDAWRLSGAVDIFAATQFAGALSAGAKSGCVLDMSDLEFIDVAGMRVIADTARSAAIPLELRDAPRAVRRHWRLAGFDRVSPGVRVAAP